MAGVDVKYDSVMTDATHINLQDQVPKLLKQSFRPLCNTLVISGQYFEWNKRFKVSLSFIYCILIWLCMCLSVIRYIFFYTTEMNHYVTITIILFHIWIIQHACGMTYFLLLGRRRMYEFFQVWQDYRSEHKCVDVKHFKPHMIKWMALFWILTVVDIIVITVIYLHVTMYDIVNLKPFSDSKEIPLAYIIFCALLHVFYAFVYFAPVLALRVFCGALGTEFKDVHTEISIQLKNKSGLTADAMETIRQRHHALCNVVSAFDRAWSPYLFLSFVFDVPLIAIHILVLVGTGPVPNAILHLAKLYGLCASCGMGMGHMGIQTLTATSLATTARAPLAILYDMDMRVIDAKTLTVIQIFQGRLRDHVGLTLWQLVNVNKSMIVTLFCVILSYMIIMLRFGLTLDLTVPVDGDHVTSGLTETSTRTLPSQG